MFDTDTRRSLICAHCDQRIDADQERTCEHCGEIVGICDEPCPEAGAPAAPEPEQAVTQ